MYPMEDDMMGEAQDMVYGEISEFADDMVAQKMVDLFENKADPKNMPGNDPAEPGITTSEDLGGGNLSDGEMAILEAEYGSMEAMPEAAAAPEMAV